MQVIAARNRQLGQQGEQCAVQYLLAHGYKIRARNVRISHDEIDIIAYDPTDAALVFVEVKARTSTCSSYSPWLNITRRKRHALFRAAWGWVEKHNFSGVFRVDVVCIVGGKVLEHVREIETV